MPCCMYMSSGFILLLGTVQLGCICTQSLKVWTGIDEAIILIKAS